MTITPGHKNLLFLLATGIILITSACNFLRWDNPIRATATSKPVTSGSEKVWTPRVGDRLQIQFAGEFEFINDVDIYDLDLFDTSVETITAIHANGKRAVCYINVGAWEEWRSDADQFPTSIIGADYEGWPGEKWLDIRQISQLDPILTTRFDLCKEKGFDGIEPDNMDGYQNETGFLLTAENQLTFNRWLASLAHARGLSIGLKNDPEQMQILEPDFDFTIMEDCFQGTWCADAESFIHKHKPAFAVEYTDSVRSLSPFCKQAVDLGVSLFLKNRNLDAYRVACD